jgi:hypothetical protein
LRWPTFAPADRAALEALYRATNGDEWETRYGWLTDWSPCEWYGVFCDTDYEHSFVRGISLSANNLRGVIPDSVFALEKLRFLHVAYNDLSGKIPESLLDRWDQNTFEFGGTGNCFSNFVTRIRLEYFWAGTLCAEEEDIHYTLDATDGESATFRSIRCVPATERDTHCLVRVGRSPSFDQLTRALAHLGFAQFDPPFPSPSGFTVTHGLVIRTTVWWGDGTSKSVETYTRDGPLEVWMAQELFFSLLQQCEWEREYFEPSCWGAN